MREHRLPSRRASGGGSDGWSDGVAAGEGSARGSDHAAVGREVHHESFGRGVVVAAEGVGGDARYTVRFASRVRKILGRFLTEASHVD
jgi:hypothetical protein